MAVTVFGLKSCDTCRRVRKELDASGTAYEFRDLRDIPLTKAQVKGWSDKVGWQTMLNRSSATWRALSAADKENLTEIKAVALMQAHPALIKRPLIERDGTQVFVGWTKSTAAALEAR